jgi:hypothetical protein
MEIPRSRGAAKTLALKLRSATATDLKNMVDGRFFDFPTAD